MNQGFLPRSVILLFLALLTVTLIGCASSAENTPPTVVIDTPEEGASLALAVTVSGKAMDTEGFNIDSYVEALWNDWEWFTLPNTPTGGNSTIVFGELVNLDWHAPGEHLLQVRAFDGELYSEIAQVNVTVRDLADLVILPVDITLDTHDVVAGDKADFRVVVGNHGGENVLGVEVVLKMNGTEVGRRVVAEITGYNIAILFFDVKVEEGNLSMVASAYSYQTIEEKSMVNNQAEHFFTIPAAGEDARDWGSMLFFIGAVILMVVFTIAIILLYYVVVSRKD